jgi:beta-glucanase (GH16 family)
LTFDRYGRVSFQVSAPKVAGVVTAAILLGVHIISSSDYILISLFPIADEHDEIDIELLGGDPSHWQSNIFTTSPKDQQPLWGVFGQIEDFPKKPSIGSLHNYTIDWSSERINWVVDGSIVRTLRKCECEPVYEP